MSALDKTKLLADVRMVDGISVVHVEDVYATDIDDLWSAVTDPARLARWIAEVEGDLRVGGSFRARFTSTWDGPGRVETCDAPTHLRLTMEPGTADETTIEATLTPEGDRTRLVVEERGIPTAHAPAHAAGWQVHLEDLATVITGHVPTPWRDRWEQLIPRYRP